MIQLRSANYIDFEKYDHCVQMDLSQLPYAQSWYLKTVCEHWDCLVLNDYDAVWPLPYRIKFGLKYYYRPFGIQQLGVFSKIDLSKEQLAAFVKEALSQVRFTDIYLNEGQTVSSKVLTRRTRLAEQANFCLPLGKSYEQIYQGFSTNLKRKLKKAQTEKLQIFESDSAQDVLKLFKEEKQKDLELSPAFYQTMEQLLFQLMHKGRVKVLTIYGGPNQLIAGAVFLEHQQRSIFLLSGLNEFGRESNAMAYLINEYLIYNADRIRLLDFEGSSNPGLARFYQSFGAENRPYFHLKSNRLPWPISLLKK